MNSHIIFIVGVLFIAVCSPPDALSIDCNSDNNQTQQMQGDRDGSQACLDLLNEMRQELPQNEQKKHEMLRNRDIHRDIDRSLEMMEEIEKNESYQSIHQEQETDILGDLLLEPASSGAPSTTSSR